MRLQATTLGVCASIGMLFCVAALAEKTTVAVEKGQVRAKTSGGEVTVEAGQKAVLASGQKPIAGVDDPMVDDLLRINTLVQAEKAVKLNQIDGVLINICSIESEKLWKIALLSQVINRGKTPATTDHIANLGDLTNPRFYDMEGRLLSYDWKKNSDNEGPCDVRLSEPVAPGAYVRYVCVGDATTLKDAMWQAGKVWHVWQANDSRNYLNYFRFILPQTAILLDVNRRPLATDVRDGRLSVTVRNYTGKKADGRVELLFLWPEKDGATLEDIPAEYGGGMDAWQASVQQQYRERMAKIRAGEDYTDQSTPLATLLTRNAAIIRNDMERMVAIVNPNVNPGRAELDRLQKGLGGMQGVRELLVDTVESVSSSVWPENPGEGATHRIEMFGKAVAGESPLPVFTMGLVFYKGKWYVDSNRPGPGLPTEDEWMKNHPRQSLATTPGK